MNNFVKRTITGAFFVIAIVGSALLGAKVFSSLFLFVSLGGMYEFLKIGKKLGLSPARFPAFLFAFLVYGLIVLTLTGLLNPEWLLSSLLLIPAVMTIELFRKSETASLNIGFTLLGIVWIVVPLALLTGFFKPGQETGWLHSGALLGFFLILWIYDSGAYIFGSIFGKHRMYERISPKKSWEGFGGGLLAGYLTAFLISASFLEFTLIQWLLIATLIIVFGTLGDLIESMLKREAGVKDSGSILPGHGGILDRFDAVFSAAPVIFIVISLLR